jgi:hypothetical protein
MVSFKLYYNIIEYIEEIYKHKAEFLHSEINCIVNKKRSSFLRYKTKNHPSGEKSGS